MGRVSLEGRGVLITGAARGLGRQLALRLAGTERAEVILADCNAAGLDVTAEEIRRLGGCGPKTIETDLAAPDAARRLFQEVADRPVYGLINNAGITYYGRTEARQIPRFRSIVAVDFAAVMELSLLFLGRFRRDGGGFILNVTSLAAFLPLPYQTVYAAMKGAAQSFSEALRAENRGGPVLISTFAPSGIVTEMIRESGLTQHMQRHPRSYLTPEQAAELAVEALKRGRRLTVPGFSNRLLFALIDILPRALVLPLAARIYRHQKYGESCGSAP